MNIAKLKNYAPQARRDFIQAVADRAAFYGLTAAKIEPVREEGDVAIIAGRAFPSSVAAKRKKLADRIVRDGFAQTMEALAYTWFNRFVAIRFMELHSYLEHGYRVLSHPDPNKTIPEILELAEHIDLPGLNKDKVIDLKLDGNKESELYRMLLLAQCRALHSAMPFLFEGIDDETELVLPENLLHSDSIIRKLVADSDPEDWQEVEVLGWLYQFYISERKDEVMGRKSAVPTEDIPAVTQLFTPHWIVRYLVENSLGRLWLLNRPGSRLREHMPYYIEGESETDFLKITKPEEICICDPACGSGHMLTYAFDLLTLIYEEEGYSRTEIPAIILRHNLHGLDICSRAAQLAGLALVLKAREKSRRFFQPEHFVQPNILELRDVHFAENELNDYIHTLGLGDLFNQPMLKLLHQFEEAKNFGSLIQPCLDEQTISFVHRAIEAKEIGSQLFLRETHIKVLRVLEQAEVLAQQYHIVVANPPYLGGRQFNSALKAFAQGKFEESKADLFSMFIDRGFNQAITHGHVAMITMESWMFLSSFEALRDKLLKHSAIQSLVHMPYLGRGRTSMGINFGTVATVWLNCSRSALVGNFQWIRYFECDDFGVPKSFPTINERYVSQTAKAFLDIPGKTIAYWISPTTRTAFAKLDTFGEFGETRLGMATADNDRFLRRWHEVGRTKLNVNSKTRANAEESKCRWFPYAKGGDYRKWYGNLEFVVDWELDGERIRNFTDGDGRVRSHNYNLDFIFKTGVTWSALTSSETSMRVIDCALFDNAGSSCFPPLELRDSSLGFLNSKLLKHFIAFISPTFNYQPGDIGKIPSRKEILSSSESKSISIGCVSLSRADWDNFETSWDFHDQPLLRPGLKGTTLEASWQNWEVQSAAAIRRMQELETENNRLFIAAYGLESELQPEVPEEQITLARADVKKDMAAFLSYAIGCMMGRYSLDCPGLILANAGDTLREYLAKVGRPQDQLSFTPDEDGIIPVLDSEWFEDDIVARACNFLCATFGEATFQENLRFIEESLGKGLREYFLNSFYKDHLQTYKKRPIYWLFSSGKQKAFQCLVYLHRYNQGTLARMRTEYVIKLQGKIAIRIDQLASDAEKASSTSHRKKLEKERDKLKKQQTELQQFDEKLRHYADLRINLDLDDGVKVNYGKFGDLLAEVNAITGGSEE